MQAPFLFGCATVGARRLARQPIRPRPAKAISIIIQVEDSGTPGVKTCKHASRPLVLDGAHACPQASTVEAMRAQHQASR
jgi:hypothetical protein